MNFEVLGVDQVEKRVSIRAGPIKLQCRILENGSNPHIIKPPYIYIEKPYFTDFIETVRSAWLETLMKQEESNE